MKFFEWSNNDPLNINIFGIPEPVSKKKKIPDILLVPLVAYDKNSNRIGYGGGFMIDISENEKDKRCNQNWISLFISESKKSSNR